MFHLKEVLNLVITFSDLFLLYNLISFTVHLTKLTRGVMG